MLYSMTGFGRQQVIIKNEKFEIEIRSLNSKSSEVRLKLPINLRDREIHLRKLVLDKALRGKIEVSIMSENDEEASDVINEKVFESYFHALKALQVKLGASDEPLFATILTLPNALEQKQVVLEKEMTDAIDDALLNTIDELMRFRAKEGETISKDLESNVNKILFLLNTVDPFETSRIDSIKFKIQNNFKKHLNELPTDGNRFEQEIIYYLEKLDINEEKVRLNQHCLYFLETLKNDDQPKGKKLNFISQEIGREINTLGAKAYHSEIQMIVVQMKDHLEKIKEQIANAL